MSSILQAIVALCFVASASLAAQDLGPEQLIQGITEEVFVAITADKELAAGDRDKVLKLAEQKVLPHVDFEEATRLALSRAWPQANAEQKRKLVTEFRAMLPDLHQRDVGVYRNAGEAAPLAQ